MSRPLPSQQCLPLTRKGRSLAKLPAPKEHVLQMTVAAHLDYRCAPEWEWTHFPAGEARDARTGAKLKAMGLKPGWPDLILISPEGVFHGLELKRPGGRPSEAQKEFRNRCIRRGWVYATAESIGDALVILTNWGAIPSEPVIMRGAL